MSSPKRSPVEHKPTTPVLDKATYTKVYACSALLGMINNNGYTLVNAVAADLAKQFDKADFMGMFSLVLLLGCFCMTLAHSRFAFRFTFGQRIAAALTLQSISYALLALASVLGNPDIGFAVALVGTVLTGFAQAIGEVNNISRLHLLPPTLIGAWGAGTGLAGIVGTLIYSVLIAAGVHQSYVMLGMILTVPAYWLLFAYVNKQAVICGETFHPVEVSEKDQDTKKQNASLSMTNAKVAFGVAGGIITNLVAVYFFEYWILSGFLDRASTGLPLDTPEFALSVVRYCSISYNVGVLISRSSVSFFQIKRVWIPTILQFGLLIFWICESNMHFIRFNMDYVSMTWTYISIIMVVGLMGGASYSNCMFQFQNRDDIPSTHRELCVNLGFAASNIGILLSSILSLLIANTIMQQCSLYPDAPTC